MERSEARAACRWGRRARAAGLAVTLLCGCGYDDPVQMQSPADQCLNFVDTYCNKEATCRPPSDRSRTIKDCSFSFEVYFPCDDVVAVHGSLEGCSVDIVSFDCKDYDPESGMPTPDSCKIFEVR